MPKAKRRKNIFGFGRKSSGNYIPATGGIAHHSAKRKAPKEHSPEVSKAIKSLGKHHIVKSGDGYRVPSLDRETLFDSREDAARFIKAVKNPKRRKRNIEVGIPKNQFVNAKVRMKGGKIQVMADERVLGKAGFKAGAGLSGVSVSGGAKLNPSARARLSRIGYSLKKVKGGYETYPTRGAGAVGHFRTLAEVQRYAKRVAHDRGFTR